MNYLSLPVVHPAFENLRRYGKLLHLTAGVFIMLHAWGHYHTHDTSAIYSWCLFIMAADIFILVFAGHDLQYQMPRVNAAFRLMESIFFLIIATGSFYKFAWFSGSFHALLSIGYAFLWYAERRIIRHECLHILHSGIIIGGIRSNTYLKWSEVKQVDTRYDQIDISTSENKKYQFPLRKNLGFDELDQIHEFCRYYLKS